MVHEAAARRALSEVNVTEVQALLGAGTRYEGKLAFEGCVRIDGEFQGEVRTDGILILGDTAKVTGDLHVGALIARGGTIHGNITATRSVELHAPAKLVGDIHAPQVFIEKGTTFTGKCTMDASATHSLPEE